MDEPRLYTVITQLHHCLIIQVCYNNTHTPKTRPCGSRRRVKRRFEVKQVALLNGGTEGGGVVKSRGTQRTCLDTSQRSKKRKAKKKKSVQTDAEHRPTIPSQKLRIGEGKR